ncbi:MAG: dehydrogenase, partial [Acidobacteriota bacterium]|nr:dehydrogenase [Acidobacteriota bacterium]
MSNNHYDVIVIGTGAGGGTIANKLAVAGKKILILERGDFLPREKDNWSSAAVQGERKYQTKEVWHDADGKEFNPQQHYYVGGNTKVYGAALFRMRAEDFGETLHHEGISPAWEMSYAELEPYYAAAEQLYGVR